jgi:hypothetical protein
MSDKLNRRDVTSVRASFLEAGMTLLELETLMNTRKLSTKCTICTGIVQKRDAVVSTTNALGSIV